MKWFTQWVIAVLFACSLIVPSAMAGTHDPLFINLTTSNSHRALMAIGFGNAQQQRGHNVTVFMNDTGVRVASKRYAAKYEQEQKLLQQIVASGGKVIVCPTCMKYYGVRSDDLLSGFEVGSPDLTGPLLFKDNGKTLTW